MNKVQRQFVVVEVIVISLLLWRYHNDQLTINNAIIYTSVYVLCMVGWLYFKDQDTV